jgi:uncharacterized protein YkvS
MNLSCVNNSSNYQKNQSFGMAVKVDKKAIPVIKEQALKLKDGQKAQNYSEFWDNLKGTIERQKDNPVNIIIKKVMGRKALSGVVVDSTAETAVKNKSFSQGLFSKNGSLEFLKKSEDYANKLNQTNGFVSEFEVASKADYKAGEKVAELA